MNPSVRMSHVHTLSPLPRPDADAWAGPLFEQLHQGHLSPQAFESQVMSAWQQSTIVWRAPQTACHLRDLARQAAPVDAGYAHDAPQLGFVSRWLAGTPGRPGAVHIQSPPETRSDATLFELNRPPHQHDSARMAVITQGEAVFHVWHTSPEGRTTMRAIPVSEGDLIVWPAWTPHTFDARAGFWLVTAMACYVSPAADGFMLPVRPDDLTSLET